MPSPGRAHQELNEEKSPVEAGQWARAARQGLMGLVEDR